MTGDGWLPGIIVEVNRPLSFQIKLQDVRMVRQHIDHIIYCSNSLPAQASDDWMDLPQVSEPNATEQSSTITKTALLSLYRSTRILVPPKRYDQDGNTST